MVMLGQCVSQRDGGPLCWRVPTAGSPFCDRHRCQHFDSRLGEASRWCPNGVMGFTLFCAGHQPMQPATVSDTPAPTAATVESAQCSAAAVLEQRLGELVDGSTKFFAQVLEVVGKTQKDRADERIRLVLSMTGLIGAASEVLQAHELGARADAEARLHGCLAFARRTLAEQGIDPAL